MLTVARIYQSEFTLFIIYVFGGMNNDYTYLWNFFSQAGYMGEVIQIYE